MIFGAKAARRPRAVVGAGREAGARERFWEKVAGKRFDEFNADDMVRFWRSYYAFRMGGAPVREDRRMALRIFKNLIGQCGAPTAMDVVACSFESAYRPASVKYFASPAVNRILDPEVFDNLRMAASRRIASWWSEGVEARALDGE